MKLPGETNAEFVEILPFTPANRNNLIGWIAGRCDGATLRHVGRLRLPQDEAGRRPPADRGAHRSERTALRATHSLESARLARSPRKPAGHPVRPRPPLRRTHLPPGPAEPHAGAAPRRSRAAGPARLRPNLRGCAHLPLRRKRLVPKRPRRHRKRHPRRQERRNRRTRTRSSAKPPKTFADYQRLTSEGKLGEAGQKLGELKRVLDQLNTP